MIRRPYVLAMLTSSEKGVHVAVALLSREDLCHFVVTQMNDVGRLLVN